MTIEEGLNGERIVVLGRVGGAFGVAGWVKVQSYTDPLGNLLRYPVWLLRMPKGAWSAIRCLEGREVSGGLQVRLEGIDSREQVVEVRGAEIGVRRDTMPQLAAGEYYLEDLLGLEARSLEGERLGTIEELLESPAHPLLRIVDGERREELVVPLVRERIKAVDLTKRCVTIDWQRSWSRDE